MDKGFYPVCGECSSGLANDDWTFLDSRSDEDMADYDGRMASVEAMGNVFPSYDYETTDHGMKAHRRILSGYSLCFVCGADAIDCQIWETV